MEDEYLLQLQAEIATTLLDLAPLIQELHEFEELRDFEKTLGDAE